MTSGGSREVGRVARIRPAEATRSSYRCGKRKYTVLREDPRSSRFEIENPMDVDKVEWSKANRAEV